MIAAAQENLPRAACTARALAALKPLPQLEYECPEGALESDELILQIPARLKALGNIAHQFESFTNESWWQAPVDELFYCQVHGAAEELTNEEKSELTSSRFPNRLLGDGRFRLMILFDPCYQTQYNGSTWFLMYRPQTRVFVSKLMDGFYTRIENSIGMKVGRLNGQPIIEITTGNTMPPRFVNYYFTIDPKTNKAIPKKLFKEGNKFTNTLESAILFADPVPLGLPADANILTAIKEKRLVKTISVFEEDERGKIENIGTNLRRIPYRWNGRFYAPAKR